MHSIGSPESYQTRLTVAGVNHRTLDVANREQLAKIGSDTGSFLKHVVAKCAVKEAAVISTCNRFEIITAGAHNECSVRAFLQGLGGKAIRDDQVYEYENGDAVRHLFRVASSLDSMVVGEAQILGQIKSAYETAVRTGTVGRYLHRLFQHAFYVAKEIRADTGVARHGVSISFVAVKLAEQIVGSLTGASLLVVGSGEMAELCALHIRARGCKEVIVANRTRSRAESLANRFGGKVVDFSDVAKMLQEVDVVLSSVAADEPILTPLMMQRRRRVRPLFLIDLGVPRNIAPSMGDLESVFLYNLDDLGTLVAQNKELRKEASKEAELLVEFGLLAFERWLIRVSATPAIIDLRLSIRKACEEVLPKELQGIVREETIERIVHQISNRTSHDLSALVGLCPNGKLSYDAILPFVLADSLAISRRER